MKSLKDVLTLSIQHLKERDVSSPRLVVETLLSHVLKMKRVDLYTQFELPLEEKELAVIRSFLKRASQGEPAEYILSEIDFYGIRVALSTDVLIPRQETEILVDKVFQQIDQDGPSKKVLFDICTGSGCAGLSLKKKLPELSVILSDLSDKALSICQKNAKAHDLDVRILQGDLLEPFEGVKADYIFCNPPYISEQEYEGLAPSVKEYEPRMALVGEKEGYGFYERLSKELPKYMNPGAKVFLEIGHLQGKGVSKIFSNPFWARKELVKDWSGKDRFFFLEIE